MFFFLCIILILFTLHCNAWTWFIRWFYPGFTISLWTTSILEETDSSSFVSSTAKSSDFQLFSFITSQNILSISSSNSRDLCYFSFSLVAVSFWNNVSTRCHCSNKRLSSVLFCTSSWVVLGCYLCNNYAFVIQNSILGLLQCRYVPKCCPYCFEF